MGESWQCPFCQHHATVDQSDYRFYNNRFTVDNKYGELVFATMVVACPNPDCKEVTLTAVMAEPKYPDAHPAMNNYQVPGRNLRSWELIPASRAKPMPAYIPASIVQDYNEACAIESLSPKASATVARRCVQQVIRGFFSVSKAKLYDEIQEIKGRVSPETWEAVDALREVGNIGAHAEKDINIIVDVEPGEAAALIRLVEILIEETYIARHRRRDELDAVKKIAAAKKAAKGGPAPPAATP